MSLELEGRERSALYRQLEERQQDLQELKALQGQGIYPVSQATSAVQTRPRPVRDGMIGLLLGLVLGLGLVFLREALDTRVRTAEEVSDRLGISLLARLPSPPRKLANKEGIAMLEEPTGVQAEAFRVLRTNLEFVNLDRHAQVIMVTSALESEGKSTTASNLAVAFARAGKRVALVDLDLRRPFIARFFRLGGRPGLTQVALGHVDLEDALVPVALSDHPPRNGAGPEASATNGQGRTTGVLEVLPSGPIPPDAGEFVATHAVGTTIQQLRERADIIIVDAPPLLGLGDAMALTSKVDGILLVARLKVARRQTVNELRRVLENVPASPLGFVITNAETDKGYGYGYTDMATASPGLRTSHRDAGRRRPFGDARPDRRSAADLPVGCHEPASPRGRLRGPRSGDRRGGRARRLAGLSRRGARRPRRAAGRSRPARPPAPRDLRRAHDRLGLRPRPERDPRRCPRRSERRPAQGDRARPGSSGRSTASWSVRRRSPATWPAA